MENNDFIQNYKNYPLVKIKKKLDEFDEFYYQGNSIINDTLYDEITEFYYHQMKLSNKKIGYNEFDFKAPLPIHMASMDKIKLDDPKLDNFLKNYTNDKLISAKLDGNSLLIGKKDNVSKAYTRGNGQYGSDVSNILPFVTSSNQTLELLCDKLENNTWVRGEIIVSKSTWHKNKYLGSNGRNFCAGVLHKKQKNYHHLKLLEFLAFDLYDDRKIAPSDTFNHLIKIGFKTPEFELYTASTINKTSLPNILKKFKDHSQYEIDGIIITDNTYYDFDHKQNPKHSKAFKMEIYNDRKNTEVTEILWKISKSGIYNPIINVKPTIVNNVLIRKIYAYNANYILKHKIGKGSIIEIIRSGDVIPKVNSVISTSFDINIDFPKTYLWDNSKTNIMIQDTCNREMAEKQMEYFVKIMEIDFLKIGTIKKLYEHGIRDVLDIIDLDNPSMISNIKGLGIKSAINIVNSIQKSLSNTTFSTFCASLPCFNNIGKKRMELLVSNIPDFNQIELSELKKKMLNIRGFSNLMYQEIANGLPNMEKYVNAFTMKYKFITINTSNHFNVCFSGFRDSELEKKIKLNGGMISSTISKNVTHLIVKDTNLKSTKMNNALKLGIKIIDKDQLNSIL